MKSTQILLAAALAIAIPATVFAGKDPAAKEAKKAAHQAIAPFDKNGNGSIDGDEIDALIAGLAKVQAMFG